MTTTENNSTPETTQQPSWGDRFRAARENLHMSEKDAASRLHLKPNIITIIETESFKDGPPAIFMRGYIRSYGRLINLPDKELVQALAQMDLINPAAATYVPQPRIETRSHSNSHVGWSTAFVILGLSALVGTWWWNAHHTGEAAPTPLADATPTAAQVAVNATTTPDSTATNTTSNITVTPNNISNGTTPPVAAPTPQTTEATAAATNTQATIAPVINTAPTPAATATNTATPSTAGTPPTTATPDTTASNTKPAIGEPSLPPLEEDEADANAATPAAKQHRVKTPEMANAQMSVPEEGLDDEPQ